MNLNTLLITVCNGLVVMLVGVVGFSVKHELETIEASQRDLVAQVMPRSEVEVRLQSIGAELNRQAAELLSLRTAQAQLEITMARWMKDNVP